MGLLDDDLDLEKKRTAAGISQVEMAKFLAISQSQISRYEQDADSVPAGVLKKWLRVCGEISAAHGLVIVDSRIEIRERITLMENYSAVEPLRNGEPGVGKVPTAAQFLAGLHTAARKPRVGVFGQFDSGKSRLLNTILGGNHLPTRYQPDTSVVSLIRHVSDKPTWQAEDVWLMKKGFDFELADDQEHCLEHRLFAGGYESLHQYGTHSGSGKSYDVFAAVVYIDSPVLFCADLLDGPGYGHNDTDKDRAEVAHKMVDALVYTSQATGFLDHQDLTYLSSLLRNLPPVTPEIGDQPSLSNLFVVATHAHHISRDDRGQILKDASLRAFKHLDNVIDDIRSQTGQEISLSDFERRFFTYSAENAELRLSFEDDIKDLLSKQIPQLTLRRLNTHVHLAKVQATSSADAWLAILQKALGEREKAQAEVAAIKAEEPARLRKKVAHEQKINGLINHFSNEAKEFVHKIFAERVNVVSIEALIKARYENKKEAYQLAAPYLCDSIQKAVGDWIKVQANELGNEIEAYLESYGPEINSGTLADRGFGFNARVAFMSALSGLGTIGALAAWASIAAAGSNLGAYILIAKIVGWLSSIGISLGSSATVIAFVSSIGGPLTLGIVVAVGVAMGTFTLFGDSWQTKLAKKIYNGLLKENAEEKFADGISSYWNDTRKAFAFAADKTEEDYLEHLKRLEILANSTNREEIERELKLATETRNFFAGMPWRPMPT